MKARATDPVFVEVAWSRLISVVEQEAQALLRTAFTNIVRESGDLSAGVFDLEGRMVAQAQDAIEPEYACIKREGAFDVRNFEMHVADGRAGGNAVAFHERILYWRTGRGIEEAESVRL